MLNRVERHRKKLIAKATPITREQCLKLTRFLNEINLPYTAFFDLEDDSIENKIVHLSNDVFIIKDYFNEFKLPSELVENID